MMASMKQLVPLATAVNRRRSMILMLGDAIVFLIFATVGRASHHEATGFDAVVATVETAVPFALGWFLVAPFLGVYRQSVTGSLRTMLGRTALGWVCSWPVAMFSRWLFTLNDKPLSLRDWATFSTVVLIANLLFLSIWRGAFALVANRNR